jgi:hypothetical protein
VVLWKIASVSAKRFAFIFRFLRSVGNHLKGQTELSYNTKDDRHFHGHKRVSSRTAQYLSTGDFCFTIRISVSDYHSVTCALDYMETV